MDFFQLASFRVDQVGPVEHQDVGKFFDAIEQLVPGIENHQFADGVLDPPVMLTDLFQAFLKFDIRLAGLQNGRLDGTAYFPYGGQLQQQLPV